MDEGVCGGLDMTFTRARTHTHTRQLLRSQSTSMPWLITGQDDVDARTFSNDKSISLLRVSLFGVTELLDISF